MTEAPEITYRDGTGKWEAVRLPFLGPESGALHVRRNSRNGMEVRHEGPGQVCASNETNAYISGKVVQLGHSTSEDGPDSSAGQKLDFRHLLVVSRPLATALDIVQEPGKMALISCYVDIADDKPGVERARFVNRLAWEKEHYEPKPPCTRSILGIKCTHKQGVGHAGLHQGHFVAQNGETVDLHWGQGEPQATVERGD